MVENKRKYTARAKCEKCCKECGSHFLGEAHSKYCSTLCLSRNEYAANMFKPEWRLRKLVAAAKNRASSKGLEFNITLDYLLGLWDASGGKCAVSGRKFDLGSYGKPGQVNPDAPSVDRIVPEIGYIIGNVRLVTYHTNVALSEFGLETLKLLAKDIISFNT